MTDSPSPIDPSPAALLVMDYQPGIVGRLPDPEAQLALMSDVIARARDQGLTIGYVRVAFNDDDLAAVPADEQDVRADRLGRTGDARRRADDGRPRRRRTAGRATSSCARPASAPSPPPICTSS